jgi:TatD DNase family protein
VRLVDSHCHLQSERFSRDIELVVGAARLAGVERILVPGWNGPSSAAALGLVDRFGWLDAAVGVHPHDAAKADDAEWATIVAMAADPGVVAVGETGLDFDRVLSPIPAQLVNLRRNLVLALDLGKPAILHVRSKPGARDAQDALLAELRQAGFGRLSAGAFGEGPPFVIHSYSGPVDFARAVLDLGGAISISGLAFRAGEEVTAEVAALAPADRMLIETDSPFLTPPGAPRGRNEPEWIRITAAWVAQKRGAQPAAFGDELVAAYDRTFRRNALVNPAV